MSLIDLLGGVLQDQGGVQQISRQLGIDQEQVEKVIGGAVPMMVSALAKNSAQKAGASALAAALGRDHDGSILDNLAGVLGQASTQKAGAGALGHMFGGNQNNVTSSLGKMSGLDASSVTKILTLLAPIILGVLGKSHGGGGGGGIDLGSLVGALAGGQQEAEQRAPQLGGILGSLLDSDGDGDIKDDLADIGAGLLGSLFKK